MKVQMPFALTGAACLSIGVVLSTLSGRVTAQRSPGAQAQLPSAAPPTVPAGPPANPQRCRDGDRSQEHDGAARDQSPASGAERQRVRTQPRQLPRSAGEPVSESARGLHPQEREEGHESSISPSSIQADNGAGLTKGIIGLVNKGQPRQPDDGGSLRAWASGASRGLDYLETDKAVDAKKQDGW
jgi:hypothetical protein